MFKALMTAIYHVNDSLGFASSTELGTSRDKLNKAKEWYSKVLGFGPYFVGNPERSRGEQPFYVGFEVAGYELGLHPQQSAASGKAEGVVAYWGVEDAQAAYKRLLELGAKPNNEPQDVGGDCRGNGVRPVRQRLRHH